MEACRWVMMTFLKGWKLTIRRGMHKHFRMMAISQHMRDHGYTPENAPHTSIAGIWKKLNSLYDMDALDSRVCLSDNCRGIGEHSVDEEQEDAILESDAENEDSRRPRFRQFSLPKRDFGARMFRRRLASNPSSSPAAQDQRTRSVSKPVAKGGRTAGRASTVEDSEEGGQTTTAPTRPRYVYQSDWM